MCLMMGGGDENCQKYLTPMVDPTNNSIYWRNILYVCCIIQTVLAFCMMT